MTVNGLPVLTYNITADTADITVGTTDLAALETLTGQEEITLLDGVGNPLYILTGYTKRISTKILHDAGACVVTLARVPDAERALQAQIAEPQARIDALTGGATNE